MKLFNYIKNLFGLGETKSNKCCGNGNCNCQKETVKKEIDTEVVQSPVAEEIPVKEKQVEEKPQETKPARKPRKPRPNTAQGEKGHGASGPRKEDNKEEKTPVKKKRFVGYKYKGKTYLDNPGFKDVEEEVWHLWKSKNYF